MRDPVTGAPTGIQRIALTWDARKIDRMMLGPAGVVMIWPAAIAARDRRGARDDVGGGDAAAVPRRGAAAGLVGAVGRRHARVPGDRRRRAS